MPNIIDTIQISGVTYTLSGGSGGGGNTNVVELTQAEYDALTTIDPTAIYIITDAEEINANDYVTKASNAASGYSYDSPLPSDTFEYDKQYKPTITIKYISGYANSGSYSAGSLNIWTNSNTSRTDTVYLQLLNGVITGMTALNSTYYTSSFVDGVPRITIKEGYYFRRISTNNGFFFFKTEDYSSGQSKNVIENTVYDVLDTVSDDIANLTGTTITSVTNSTSDGQLCYTYNRPNNRNISSCFVFYDNDTIKYSSNKGLYLEPIEGDYHWKKQNLANNNYCSFPSNQLQTYAESWKKIRLKLNPSYTQSSSLEIRLRVGGVQNKYNSSFNTSTSVFIYFNSINNTLDTNNVIGTYCISNITYDSTNHLIEVTMNENTTYNGFYYCIYQVGQANCYIGRNYLITEIYNWSNERNPIEYLMENKADASDLGGLKLVKLTQTEYDALVTKDSNTLFVIVN